MEEQVSSRRGFLKSAKGWGGSVDKGVPTLRAVWTKRLSAIATVAAFALSFAPSVVEAMPIFSKANNMECIACHTTFPRLNSFGERFMRNGFAIPNTVGASDGDLVLVKDLANMVGVRGKISVFDQRDTDLAEKSIGSPNFFQLFLGGQLAPDVPVWAEVEVTADGKAEVHNYTVGWTNVLKNSSPENATLVNFRVGGFTPTDWTSMNDQKRSLDSDNSHPGAYRGKGGFTQVGNGLGAKTGIEYYGYTDSFFWAAGVGDDTGGNWNDTKPSSGSEFWLVGRFDLGDSSISLLHMDFGDVSSNTLSANWRINTDAELRAQYSVDNSGKGAVDDVSGYTVQGDWTFAKGWAGIVRYDTTDNGRAVDFEATQATVALAWMPWQNIKLTAAYINEIDAASYWHKDKTLSVDPKANTISLQLQFAM